MDKEIISMVVLLKETGIDRRIFILYLSQLLAAELGSVDS